MYEEERPTHKAMNALLEEIKKQLYTVYGEARMKERYNEKEILQFRDVACNVMQTQDFSEPVDAFLIQNQGAGVVYFTTEEAVYFDGIYSNGLALVPSFLWNGVDVTITPGANIQFIRLKTKRINVTAATAGSACVVVWGLR